MYSIVYNKGKDCEYNYEADEIIKIVYKIIKNKGTNLNVVKKKEIEDCIYFLEFGQTYQTNGITVKCFSEQELIDKLQTVANKISKKSNITNKFLSWDNDVLTWDFDLGLTYMKFKDNYGYYMTINILQSNGDYKQVWKIQTKSQKEFILKCSEALIKISKNKRINKTREPKQTMPVNEIIRSVKLANANSIEWHASIYNDGIWTINIERHPYRVIRFWVSREDKHGNYNNTLFTPYEIKQDGTMRYGADFQIKKAVVDKITSVYKALLKENLTII